MSDPLTPEQINLLRRLPSRGEFFTMNAAPYYVDPVTTPIHRHPDERLRPYVDGTKDGFYRRFLGDVLLATIDSKRERVLEAIVGNLENAATDCDGHTPYSILMALAEEIRAEHSANPQTKEAGQ